MKRPAHVEIAALEIDRRSEVSLVTQVYEGLRRAILDGALKPGARLPSSRLLATQLAVSRNTVIYAFEQLQVEGYIEGAVGSGSRVRQDLPDQPLERRERARRRAAVAPRPSARSSVLIDRASSSLMRATKPLPFRLGTPAFELFPTELWRTLVSKELSRARVDHLMYANTQGYPPLCEAIADYLTTFRGVRCTKDQVVIFSGAQHALRVLAHLLLDPGDTVWFEEPGYLAARRAFESHGGALEAIPVDDDGMNIAFAKRHAPAAKVIYTTPSHQHPLGATMPIARRLELIEYAETNGAWIIEDDYNSEFRYEGRPLSALQGLASEGHVLYVGTFSKVFFPALRIGYAVLPPELVSRAVFHRSLDGVHSYGIEQAALARFMSDGHFERHIRRMREAYSERKSTLETYLRSELPSSFSIAESQAGMHLVLRLPPGVNDSEIVAAASAKGVETTALSRYFLGTTRAAPKQHGLLLGYTGFPPKRLLAAAERLCDVLRPHGERTVRGRGKQ